MKDWPLLEEAVDAKIEDQEEFVAWWNAHVRRAGNPELSPINADRSFLDRAAAEASTGIKQVQVSRWRKHLADKPKYRDRVRQTIDAGAV